MYKNGLHETVTFRLTSDEKQQLIDYAAKDDRSVGNEIRYLLFSISQLRNWLERINDAVKQ